MIALLLLTALLVLGLLGLGVYLLFFRSDPAPEAGQPRPESTASADPPAPEGTGSRPDGGSGSTAEPGRVSVEDLESTALDYVDAVNGRDEAAATDLTCERENAGALFSATGGREVRLVRVEVLEGAVGTAQLRVGDGETALLLENREDRWCVAI